MDFIAEYQNRADQGGAPLKLFLFGWTDNQGNVGDYGLNLGPASKTFRTLISTTYMFQPEPAFKLQCRAFEMSPAQFEFLQDHDLDQEEFLLQLGPLPEICYELDLALFKSAQEALAELEKTCV